MIIEIRGIPAPQGSKRHVGHGIMVESSKAVGPWREAVRAETQRACHGRIEFAEGGVTVSVTFQVARPRGHFGSGRNAGVVKGSAPELPAVRPDLDKLVRAVLDGLTAGGAWSDDAQVVRLYASKTYGTPGALIQFGRWPL